MSTPRRSCVLLLTLVAMLTSSARATWMRYVDVATPMTDAECRVRGERGLRALGFEVTPDAIGFWGTKGPDHKILVACRVSGSTSIQLLVSGSSDALKDRAYADHEAMVKFLQGVAGPAPPPPPQATPPRPPAGCPEPNAPNQCLENFESYGSQAVVSCVCTASLTLVGKAYGTDVYTSDSAPCKAALHAGVIPACGGPVTVYAAPGRASYEATFRNGIQSLSWGAYAASFTFSRATADRERSTPQCGSAVEHRGTSRPWTCWCDASATASGNVWGSDVYTDDSTICRAALHAGVIGASGGEVTVVPLPAQSSYRGSMRHGVQSTDYGAWHGSFRFER